MKYDIVLTDNPDLSPHGRRRGLYSSTRYWSRSYLIELLRETGELYQMGGEQNLRTLCKYKINLDLKKFGYVNVNVYDDDDPTFLGAPKNEPDFEAIYNIMLADPLRYGSKTSLRRLYRRYRTTGTDE